MDLSKYDIPKRLNPDNLTDAIITIGYKADYSKHYLEKTIIDYLNSQEGINKFTEIKIPQREIERYGTEHFWGSSDYRLIISEYEIQVNIVDSYVGWATYENFIEQLLKPVFTEMAYTHLRLRYISSYKDVSIFEKLDGTFKFNHMDTFLGATLQFNCKHSGDDGDYVVKTVLTDRMKNKDGEEYSLVDISLSGETRSVAYADMMTLLRGMHYGEKFMFYSILEKEFVDTLNPEY